MSIWVDLWVNNTFIPSFAFGSVNRGITYLRRIILKDYVIRIYRRQKNDPRNLAGVVEEVGVEGDKTFSNLDELWSLLNSSKAQAVKGKNATNPWGIDIRAISD